MKSLFAGALLLATSCPANAGELRIKHFDGRPAAGATVTIYIERGGQFSSRELRADDGGKLVLEPEERRKHRIQAWFAIVRAEGAATGLWKHLSGGEIVLAPAFELSGSVLTEDGKPVADADVRVVHFGLGSYTPIIRYQLNYADPPEFSTRTDADGGYRLPGATLQGYDWPVGGMLNIMAIIDGKLHTGALNQPYLSDSAFFERKGYPEQYFKHPDPVTVYPSGSISGTVVHHGTGEPVAGAVVNFSCHWFPNVERRTDERGRFTIPHAQRHAGRHFVISHPDIPEFHLSEKGARTSAPDIRDLRIEARQLVKMRGQLIDGGTGLAPPIGMGIDYQSSISHLSGEWVERYRGVSGFTHAAKDGSFEMGLPAGASHVEVRPTARPGFQYLPYQHANIIELEPDAEFTELNVPRNPGILFSTRMDGDPDPEDIVWRQLIPRIRRGELPTKIFSPYSQRLWFYPADRWGEKMTIGMEFSNGRQRKMLLPKAEFAALEAAPWPVKIELPAPPAAP